MVLTVGEVSRLAKLLRRNVQTKEQLIRAVEALNTVSVEGVKITLEEGLLTRLKTRCLDKNNFPRWLTETVIKQLHDYAGW